MNLLAQNYYHLSSEWNDMKKGNDFTDNNREDIYIKSGQVIHMLFILCAKGIEGNAEFIENEIQDIVASLLRAGYERDEIIKAFNDWQNAYEKDNACIDEHLNRIFNPESHSKLKDSKLYNRLVDRWIESDKAGQYSN